VKYNSFIKRLYRMGYVKIIAITLGVLFAIALVAFVVIMLVVKPKDECVIDTDCSEGQICANGSCTGCTSNNQCDSNLCVDGVCTVCQNDRNCSVGVCDQGKCVECIDDDDCPNGVCDNGVCVAVPPPGSPSGLTSLWVRKAW
jgi:Cys-rich repeat protein